MSSETGRLLPCGCCVDAASSDPGRHNRPGLARFDYRIDTHSSFLRRMLERISLETVEAGPHAGARTLAPLGTRDPADPSIAILDAAAVMFDVLTFYQERIANEGFLGTSTERLSTLELARAIGYELSPGVAADVTLVFTLDEQPGKAPSTALIGAGTKVQSLPVDGDPPQTFETVADFTARRSWNTLTPRATYPQHLRVTDSGALQRSSPSGAAATDQIVLDGAALQIDPGDLLVAHLDGGTTVLRVTAVDEQLDAAVTTLTVATPTGVVDEESADFTGTGPGAAAGGPREMTSAAVADLLPIEFSESDLQLALEDWEWDADAFADAVAAATADPPPAPHPTDGIFVMRRRVGVFGNNAQPWLSIPVSQRLGEWTEVEDTSDPPNPKALFVDPVYGTSWDANTVWQDGQQGGYTPRDLHLERELDDVLDEGWIVLGDQHATPLTRAYRIDAASSSTRADYGLSGKVTGLDLLDHDGTSATKPASFQMRSTTVHAASEWLPLAPLDITDTVADSSIELDRMVLGLAIGNLVAVSGDLDDPEGVSAVEVATISAIVHRHGRTRLEFDEPLGNEYRRDSVTVSGNVVRATHGETIEQPLGSGDASTANQAFGLRAAPLTYVSAANVDGRESTLEVRVNGRRWDETRSLYGAAPDDERYIVRIDDDAAATVTFGDGVSGARPATGAENITATYRTGIGPNGEVDAETIQLLLTRPPGVKGVDNPLPAAGAEAPESFADAKRNAPMTVRTLERVVSLTDFEDFAATFAGIGKARADVLTVHARRLVHLTVGSSSGGEVSDSKIELLQTAIEDARDPGETVCVSTYRPLSFDVVGSVKTDPALVHAAVVEAVHAALAQTFSFAERRFGQGASVAEMMSVIHGVDGVVACDIDRLEIKGAAATTVMVPPLGVMRSRPARLKPGVTVLGCSNIEPADLLLINPSGIDLGEMK